MRPFFSFYGGKWRAVSRRYPRPLADGPIIEPFAGSAGYSTRFGVNREVRLYDIDENVAATWDYLLSVSPEEILALPDLRPGQTVHDLPISQEARCLIGWWLNKASSAPCTQPSSWMRQHPGATQFWGPAIRQRIAAQLVHIRRWTFTYASWEDVDVPPNSTVFIDPPYQDKGRHYRHNKIDYERLGIWCQALVRQPGLVIVCENKEATWLSFEPIRDIKARHHDHRSHESVWMVRTMKRRRLGPMGATSGEHGEAAG